MAGSGSAPSTMAPGWPHGVQQDIVAGGVLRGTEPGAHCSVETRRCLLAWRASAGEAMKIPRLAADTTNPIQSDLVLIFTRSMRFSIVPCRTRCRRPYKPAAPDIIPFGR